MQWLKQYSLHILFYTNDKNPASREKNLQTSFSRRKMISENHFTGLSHSIICKVSHGGQNSAEIANTAVEGSDVVF